MLKIYKVAYEHPKHNFNRIMYIVTADGFADAGKMADELDLKVISIERLDCDEVIANVHVNITENSSHD